MYLERFVFDQKFENYTYVLSIFCIILKYMNLMLF